MSTPGVKWPAILDRLHPALLQWAEVQTPAWVRPKLDPADLVQQTLLEAVRDPDRLAERPDAEVLTFLRRALTNNLIDALRKFARNRGDIGHEVLAESSRRLDDWLAAADTSPSERAARNERFAKLAAGLSRLPDDQRVAVELRYLQGCKVAEITRILDRSEGAVSQLLHRAVIALRDDLKDLGL